MITNLYLQASYLVTFSSIKEWKKYEKNSYVRFRINYSISDGGIRAERCFNKAISHCIDSDFCFYSTFLTSNNIVKPFYSKVDEFLNRNKITVIKMVYGHLAGLMFPDKKSKEIFLLKYSDMFPSNCIIK